MKKTALFLALTLLLLAAAGCGSEAEVKAPVVGDVMKAVMQQIEFPEMAEQDEESLAYNGYEDVKTEDIVGLSYSIASSGLTPEEILIVQMKDDSQIAELKKMMEAHRDSLKTTAQDYTPELVERIDNAVIETKGTYAYFVISGDNETAKAIYDQLF